LVLFTSLTTNKLTDNFFTGRKPILAHSVGVVNISASVLISSSNKSEYGRLSKFTEIDTLRQMISEDTHKRREMVGGYATGCKMPWTTAMGYALRNGQIVSYAMTKMARMYTVQPLGILLQFVRTVYSNGQVEWTVNVL